MVKWIDYVISDEAQKGSFPKEQWEGALVRIKGSVIKAVKDRGLSTVCFDYIMLYGLLRMNERVARYVSCPVKGGYLYV